MEQERNSNRNAELAMEQNGNMIDGIINNGKGALTYDKDTTVIIVDGTKHVEGGDIDEIVYVEGDTDASSKVVLVPGTGDDAGHADYVFIIR